MDFYSVIKRRRSIRKYQGRVVEQDKLERVLEAARIAPSATNAQPFRFMVVTTREVRERLRASYDREWFWRAPVIICACGSKEQSWRRRDGRSYLDVDVAIAVDHLILAATAEGLGTCWIADFDPEEAKKVLDLPDDMEPIVMTPLGYPAAAPGPTSRKPLDEVVKFV